ncbi:MAG: CZB domain-containing protein [Sulfuricurvum sp.]
MENTTFITLAKIDHIIFKSNAYKSIANGKLETVFSDHHSCRLGKWYDTGAGKERFSHLPSYKNMQQPHAAVHTIVLANMKYIENEDRSIYHKESILDSFQEMENESQTLFALMDSLNKESEEYLMKQA